MSDPQNLGLGELGQRMQAMSDPATEPRLRPYQGVTATTGAASNGTNGTNGTNGAGGRFIAPYEPQEDFRGTSSSQLPPQIGPQSVPAVPYAAPYSPYTDSYTGSTASATTLDPYTPLGSGSSHTQATSSTPPPAAQASLPAPEDPNSSKTGLQRALNAVRSTLPLVQRLLPLLDGNFATVIGALMAPQAGHHPPPPLPVQQVHVDLEPVERGLADVRTSHRELRGQVLEQGTTLKRVEDQLERVREATDRNTLEQQELIEDLRATGSRISTFAIVGLSLLAISLALNIYFLVQLQHILR